MRVKEKSEKVSLKHSIQRTKITKTITTCAINLYQTDRRKCININRFYFLGLNSLWMMTAAMKLKDLLLGRKAMTNLDSILNNKDINMLTNVRRVKAMVFPVDMYGW